MVFLWSSWWINCNRSQSDILTRFDKSAKSKFFTLLAKNSKCVTKCPKIDVYKMCFADDKCRGHLIRLKSGPQSMRTKGDLAQVVLVEILPPISRRCSDAFQKSRKVDVFKPSKLEVQKASQRVLKSTYIMGVLMMTSVEVI